MSIRITNLLRTAQTFNIPRDVAPVRKHYARSLEHTDGTFEKKDVRVVHGDSLTVLGRKTSAPVPNEWRTTPDIAKAARARTITIEDVTDVLEASAEKAPEKIDEEPEIVIESPAPAVPAPVQQKSSGKGGSR